MKTRLLLSITLMVGAVLPAAAAGRGVSDPSCHRYGASVAGIDGGTLDCGQVITDVDELSGLARVVGRTFLCGNGEGEVPGASLDCAHVRSVAGDGKRFTRRLVAEHLCGDVPKEPIPISLATVQCDDTRQDLRFLRSLIGAIAPYAVAEFEAMFCEEPDPSGVIETRCT